MLSPFYRLHSFIGFFALLITMSAYGQDRQYVVSEKVKIGRAYAYVVTADLASSHVDLGLFVATHHPSNHLFPHETFASMISKTNPTAAINGTYYDTKTFIPVGTLASHGQMLQRGTHGIAVCFDKNNRVGFYKVKDLKNFPWQNFKVVISTGPTLVESGHIHLFPRTERFHDRDIFKLNRRSAIGVTKNNKLLIVAVRTPVGLRDLAWIMRKLGAIHAVSLDGGSSTGLYYRGKYLIRPSRQQTNIFMVYEDRETRISKNIPDEGSKI